jgi:hypothetical protein
VSPEPGSSPLRAAFGAFVGVHALFLVMWTVVVATSGPQQNDWALFKAVADRFAAGQTAGLYAHGDGMLVPRYLWIHPPFVLWLIAVLAPLPPLGAYLLLATTAAGATAWSLRLLDRARSLGDARDLWVLSVLCSAPLLTTVVTGQLSGLILLCLAAAGAVWTGGNAVGAAALLGLLVAKPNWGAFFGLMMLVRGEWRAAAAMAAVALACCASSLPLGLDLWAEFFRSGVETMALQGRQEPYTLVTLRGFLDAVMPSPAVALATWGASAAVLLGAAASLWRRSASSPLDCVAATVLLILAANPYAHFYDALALVVPATVWWTERERWPHAAWKIVGAMIALAWTWEHAAWSWPMLLRGAGIDVKLPFSLVGPVAAAWLLVWAWVRPRAAR